MKLIRSLVIILLLGVHVNVYAAADDDRFGWMNSTFDSITTFIAGCIEVPQFASITKNTHSLNLNNSGEWVSTGTYVAKDKLLQIEWSTKGVQPRPAKYKVLYRIDPRFAKPQIFIQRYDYAQDKYDHSD